MNDDALDRMIRSALEREPNCEAPAKLERQFRSRVNASARRQRSRRSVGAVVTLAAMVAGVLVLKSATADRTVRVATPSPRPVDTQVVHTLLTPVPCATDLGEHGLPPTSPAELPRNRMVTFLRSQLGKPYQYGGVGPDAFDASGLVMHALEQVQIPVPHNAKAQGTMFPEVTRRDAQPGDLLMFKGGGHIGVYIGDGQMIHAAGTGSVVKIESADRDGLTRISRPPYDLQECSATAKSTPIDVRWTRPPNVSTAQGLRTDCLEAGRVMDAPPNKFSSASSEWVSNHNKQSAQPYRYQSRYVQVAEVDGANTYRLVVRDFKDASVMIDVGWLPRGTVALQTGRSHSGGQAFVSVQDNPAGTTATLIVNLANGTLAPSRPAGLVASSGRGGTSASVRYATDREEQQDHSYIVLELQLPKQRVTVPFVDTRNCGFRAYEPTGELRFITPTELSIGLSDGSGRSFVSVRLSELVSNSANLTSRLARSSAFSSFDWPKGLASHYTPMFQVDTTRWFVYDRRIGRLPDGNTYSDLLIDLAHPHSPPDKSHRLILDLNSMGSRFFGSGAPGAVGFG
ncbi:MAG: C40 family peptidase [Acidimicrobiia bacterium]